MTAANTLQPICDIKWMTNSEWKFDCIGEVEEKKRSPVPIAEFVNHVNELKGSENYEFQKEYDVSVKQKTFT